MLENFKRPQSDRAYKELLREALRDEDAIQEI